MVSYRGVTDRRTSDHAGMVSEWVGMYGNARFLGVRMTDQPSPGRRAVLQAPGAGHADLMH